MCVLFDSRLESLFKVDGESRVAMLECVCRAHKIFVALCTMHTHAQADGDIEVSRESTRINSRVHGSHRARLISFSRPLSLCLSLSLRRSHMFALKSRAPANLVSARKQREDRREQGVCCSA